MGDLPPRSTTVADINCVHVPLCGTPSLQRGTKPFSVDLEMPCEFVCVYICVYIFLGSVSCNSNFTIARYFSVLKEMLQTVDFSHITIYLRQEVY